MDHYPRIRRPQPGWVGCPPGALRENGGRDFELWQPLLALASWIEEAGALGLLGLFQEHALATIDSARDDQAPDHDETLLRLLAEGPAGHAIGRSRLDVILRVSVLVAILGWKHLYSQKGPDRQSGKVQQ
ncbi:MAG TPA: hypothetical protein VNA25_09195 [Phycisphaerae bacterium]|nr:hypothetical protein [Phycisphaerae bacterium]